MDKIWIHIISIRVWFWFCIPLSLSRKYCLYSDGPSQWSLLAFGISYAHFDASANWVLHTSYGHSSRSRITYRLHAWENLINSLNCRRSRSKKSNPATSHYLSIVTLSSSSALTSTFTLTSREAIRVKFEMLSNSLGVHLRLNQMSNSFMTSEWTSITLA